MEKGEQVLSLPARQLSAASLCPQPRNEGFRIKLKAIKGNRRRRIAPNAPHRVIELPPHPSELLPLIKSGVAFHDNDHWFVHRCTGCGKFSKKCCGVIQPDSAVRHGEKTLTAYGRQAVGLDPIKPPKSREQFEREIKERIKDAEWMTQFRSIDELEGNGSIKMFIEDFLPEGMSLICGLPKEGKSFLALSVAKALTSGKPLFGNGQMARDFLD